MRGIDLAKFKFDWDLTFSVLLMHPNGKVYHRFGGRNAKDPQSWISMPALVRLMKLTLTEHQAFKLNPQYAPPKKVTISDYRAYKHGKPNSCVRCHQVCDAEQTQLKADGKWSLESIWKYPDPKQVGLTFDPLWQNTLTDTSLFAKKAGLKKGDVIVEANQQKILSITDMMYVLEHVPNTQTELDITAKRGDKLAKLKIPLTAKWKNVDPMEYAWRHTMWGISPSPGFGGNKLDAAALKANGLKADSYAFKVRYMVTWGENAHRGRNAQKAGIRKGDIVYATNGKSDFPSGKHFHAWFRFNHKVGEDVKFNILRNGQRKVVTMKTVK